MAQTKDIVISEFQKGIADSPEQGFHDMHHVDISTYPGIVTPNPYPTTQNSVNGLWKWSIRTSSGTVYTLSETGTLFIGDNLNPVAGNTKTQAHGNGLAYWHNYIFVFRDSVIDVYDPNAGTWTNNWQTMTSGDIEFHPTVSGQDDILYYGDGRYIGAISEKSGTTFDPADPATYNFNPIALTLPKQYRVKCMAELGTNLMIGTIVGNSFWGGATIADIFPWDRSSTTFRLPVKLNEVGVHQMVTLGNRLYAVAGTQPKIYVSDGYNTQRMRSIPTSVMDFTKGSVNLYPGAIMAFKDKILFGVSTLTVGSLSPGNVGIWSITTDGVLTYEYQPAQGLITGENSFLVGMVAPSSSSNLLVGYQYGGTSWVDSITEGNVSTFYMAYLQSALYQVGTPLVKRKFQQALLTFAQPLASGDGIVVKARQGLSDPFTTVGTVDYETKGAVASYSLPFRMDSLSTLQVRAELKGGIQLKEIRLR